MLMKLIKKSKSIMPNLKKKGKISMIKVRKMLSQGLVPLQKLLAKGLIIRIKENPSKRLTQISYHDLHLKIASQRMVKVWVQELMKAETLKISQILLMSPISISNRNQAKKTRLISQTNRSRSSLSL